MFLVQYSFNKLFKILNLCNLLLHIICMDEILFEIVIVFNTIFLKAGQNYSMTKSSQTRGLLETLHTTQSIIIVHVAYDFRPVQKSFLFFYFVLQDPKNESFTWYVQKCSLPEAFAHFYNDLRTIQMAKALNFSSTKMYQVCTLYAKYCANLQVYRNQYGICP